MTPHSDQFGDAQVIVRCVQIAAKCSSVHGVEVINIVGRHKQGRCLVRHGILDGVYAVSGFHKPAWNIGSGAEQSEANIDLRTAPFITSSERTDESYISVYNRVWQHVPSLDNVLTQFLPISKTSRFEYCLDDEK